MPVSSRSSTAELSHFVFAAEMVAIETGFGSAMCCGGPKGDDTFRAPRTADCCFDPLVVRFRILEKLSMSVDRDTVVQIARLARIRIEEDQLEPLAAELSNILGWIEQLNELDTEGVEPMTSVVEIEAPLRADEVTDGNCRDQILANAPEATEEFFVVPKVVE